MLSSGIEGDDTVDGDGVGPGDLPNMGISKSALPLRKLSSFPSHSSSGTPQSLFTGKQKM